jgi:DNA-binding transcriptional LysR family regulator
LIYTSRSYGAAWRIDGTASISDGKDAAERNLEIGCFSTFGPFIMPELISRMMSSGSKVKFSMTEGDQRRIQEGLLSGQTEIALLYEHGVSDDLDYIPLTELKPYVLLPADHALASAESLTVEDLVAEPMILLNAPPARDYFTSIFEEKGLTPNVVMTSVSMEMVRGLVGRGLGYSLLATKPAGDISYDGQALATVPLVTDAPTSKIVMATRRNVPLSKAAEEFAWHCRDYFALEA